jgi:SAM-dependent methyltransferase
MSSSPIPEASVKQKALGFYACPVCGREGLTSLEACAWPGEGGNKEAGLQCFGCKVAFPVIDGIPRFVPSDNYAGSFGYQWNLHGNTQLDSVTGFPISRNRLFDATGWPENMRGETILEAGSGAGRFTEVLLGTGAEVFSFDYSSAVEANGRNNGGNGRLHLFQGDIRNIPLRRAAFDRVLCLGVIQHTPDPESSFRSLTRFVRPGGRLVVDVYAKKLLSLMHWKYLLRPITTRMNKERLYKIVNASVPLLLPVSTCLKRLAGRAGARLVPIAEHSQLGLPVELRKQWSILDTFDMYSPAHDHPQTLATMRRWFEEAAFVDVSVRYGPNGIVGKGRRPGPSIGESETEWL